MAILHSQARSQITSLSVRSLALQSDTHANTPWPWDELTIDTLYIADLCKLPDPSGVEDGVWVECTTLIVHNDTIAQVRIGGQAFAHTHLHIHMCTRTQTDN